MVRLGERPRRTFDVLRIAEVQQRAPKAEPVTLVCEFCFGEFESVSDGIDRPWAFAKCVTCHFALIWLYYRARSR